MDSVVLRGFVIAKNGFLGIVKYVYNYFRLNYNYVKLQHKKSVYGRANNGI
ncbi:hypothetical protein SDC9_22471 [bioreactor metagenome]|uniref:Uncharacterized protein n=1 Tax=bioreactor metagenome TaxID=1076179 RepID=A0A644UCA9_9ZZZZ